MTTSRAQSGKISGAASSPRSVDDIKVKQQKVHQLDNKEFLLRSEIEHKNGGSRSVSAKSKPTVAERSKSAKPRLISTRKAQILNAPSDSIITGLSLHLLSNNNNELPSILENFYQRDVRIITKDEPFITNFAG